jgi:hypothetical protein
MSKAKRIIVKQKSAKPDNSLKRNYVSQADIPSKGFDDTLRIPSAIFENYAGGPIRPLQLAQALDLTLSSSHFRMLCGSSIAYGLTEGGYNAPVIKVTDLAKRIFKPQEEGDDLKAKRECFIKPRVISEFMKKYNSNLIPKEAIALNVLETMGVPQDKTKEVFDTINFEGARLGLIKDIKGRTYIDLAGTDTPVLVATSGDDELPSDENIHSDVSKQHFSAGQILESSNILVDSLRKKRVYVSHGKDTSFVEPIKKLLRFGEMEAIVSVEKQSVSKPVPDKVMADMRGCGAAIIHVDAELKLMDKDAKEHLVLNPNVLIEIGAALALYSRRFILLVKRGITLP